jgi:hypothetical protein
MVLCQYLTRPLINQLIEPVLFGLSHISASCLTHTVQVVVFPGRQLSAVSQV